MAGPFSWTKSVIFPWSCNPNYCGCCRNARFGPWGLSERVRIDLRIIAATNRDLESAIRTGGFRQDLLFPTECGPD